MSGNVSFSNLLEFSCTSEPACYVNPCPVRLQLRAEAMQHPNLLESALVGAVALYDENGDEEGLLENLKVIR